MYSSPDFCLPSTFAAGLPDGRQVQEAVPDAEGVGDRVLDARVEEARQRSENTAKVLRRDRQVGTCWFFHAHVYFNSIYLQLLNISIGGHQIVLLLLYLFWIKAFEFKGRCFLRVSLHGRGFLGEDEHPTQSTICR